MFSTCQYTDFQNEELQIYILMTENTYKIVD